jgi:glycosidase
MRLNLFQKSIILSFSYIILQDCSLYQPSNRPPELIEFRTIESGNIDSVYIDELFFKENYNLEFSLNGNVKIDYDTINNILICKPSKNFQGLTFINFKSDGDDKVLPIIVQKKTEVLFSYKPKTTPKKMFVMGNFNNWNRTHDEMLDEDGDGTYSKTIPLDDGIYEYQFVIDKTEIFDPFNNEKVDNGFGYFNSLKRIESNTKNDKPNIYFLPKKSKKWLELTIDVQSLNDVDVNVLLDNNFYSNKFYRIEKNKVKINLIPLESLEGIHALRIVATKNNLPGNIITTWINDGDLELASETFIWNDAIIYSVMTDRFYNGNSKNDNPVEHPELTNQANFNGGDLQGIITKIREGYFDSLGINTLWIFPLNKTTDEAFKEWPEPHRYYSGYHGYWPIDSREVESRFGSLQDFKTLVNEAHNRDIKVLLDFISNHTHVNHPYYRDNPEWYGIVDLPNGEKNIRRWDEYRLTTWFDAFLPSYNFLDNPEVIDTVTADALWWLLNTNIDGFRHDATKHVPHQFWKSLTRKIKTKINPNRQLDIYQIGETFGSHNLIKSYVNKGMLDAQFNFNQFFIARRVFSESESNFLDLSSSIEKSLEVYGYNHVMGNLMDSHDQVRMMALFDGDITLSEDATERAFQLPKIEVDDENSYRKEILYFTYLLSVPGIPVIYYGDEIGMTGAGDPDNRRMMRFDNELNPKEKEQLEKIKILINLRKKHSALRRGDFKTLYVTRDVLVFIRGDYNERLITCLNKSGNDEIIKFSLPDWIKAASIKSLIYKMESGIINNSVEIKIPAYSANILKILSI